MDFDKESFQSVVFFRSLHHLIEVDTVLTKAHRILEKGGNIIVCEPMRDKFTQDSAKIAGILRAVLPTWQSFDDKYAALQTSEDFDRYFDEIFTEYTYEQDHTQSPCDNSINSDEMINFIKDTFRVVKEEYSDAFIDKLIGGLRGDSQFLHAQFLKKLDDYMIFKNILPPTSVRIHAMKD